MTKNELRKKYKQLRNDLSRNEIETLSIDIANQLLTLSIWDQTYYHIFLPIEEQNEIDTSFILSILQGKDKEVVLSKCNFTDFSMVNYLLTENTLIKKNKYNIPEPIDGLEVPISKIDVVFIPLLAFDKNGHRVGYGKGFYDRFLSKCNPKTIKIGLSFFKEENEINGVSKSDIKLNYCITPKKIYGYN